MTHQIKHHRKSKNGVVFIAGRGRVPIPPAWKNVKRHQGKNYVVTGVDEKGKTQYIYKQCFIDKQKEEKFSRSEKLRKDLKSIMSKVHKDVKNGVPEAQTVLALKVTGLRIGGSKTDAEKQAYGLTTLRKNQVQLKGGNSVVLDFVGKSGVETHKEVKNSLLHEAIKENLSEGNKVFPTNDVKVREYLKEVSDGKYVPKDFRTLYANEIARECGSNEKKVVGEIVSKELNNTKSVALNSYVNPKLIKE